MNDPVQHVFESDKPIQRDGEPLPDPQTAEQERARGIALEGVHHGLTLPNEEDVIMGAPGCMRCEVMPTPLIGPGTLHIQFPHTFTLGKAVEFFAGSRYPHCEENGTLQITVRAGESLAPILSPLMERMSSTEQRDTRARFQRTGQDGSLSQMTDFSEIESLPDFAAHVRSTWLLDILREKRIYSIFQPIVHCRATREASSEPDSIFGYECLMRANLNGTTISPLDMLEMARAAGLIFQLDLQARRSSIAAAAQHGIKQKIFINFTPSSIYNPISCLDSTVRLVDELQIPHDQVVFEIIESERLPDMPLTKRIVNFYRDNGFGVALDDVGSGFSTLSLLIDLKPDYVKVDRSLMRRVDQEPDRALIARKLLEVTQELKIVTIVEGIETEDELHWAHEHGAELAQGFLFAPPALPPPLQPQPPVPKFP